MIKIPLLSIQQKGFEFYLLCYSPREIIKLVDIPNNDEIQENQRPWKESKVKEIVKYVSGRMNLDFSKRDDKTKKKAKGIIPNCPILNLTPIQNKISSSTMRVIKEQNGSYLLFPETKEEFESNYDSIQILDGQHRLIAFSNQYMNEKIMNDENYTMGYVLFNNLESQMKKEVFMVSNDKQDKVEKNVLRKLMRWLGLLTSEEAEVDLLIMELNKSEYKYKYKDDSNIERTITAPLKGRISIEGEKIKNGFKLVQLQRIFAKSSTMEKLSSYKLEEKVEIINRYLISWDIVFPGQFNNPKHVLGKISGFRYIFFLFPTICEILEKQNLKLTVTDVNNILKVLKECKLNDIFLGKSNESNDEKLLFRAETSTIALARNHSSYLKNRFIDPKNEKRLI